MDPLDDPPMDPLDDPPMGSKGAQRTTLNLSPHQQSAQGPNRRSAQGPSRMPLTMASTKETTTTNRRSTKDPLACLYPWQFNHHLPSRILRSINHMTIPGHRRSTKDPLACLYPWQFNHRLPSHVCFQAPRFSHHIFFPLASILPRTSHITIHDQYC